jgi:hypothetical protein
MTRRSSRRDAVVQVVEDSSNAAAEFETASLSTRLFLCLSRGLEVKKICLLIVTVWLLLIVQLIHLVAPPDFLASKSGQQLINATNHWTDIAGQLANLSIRLEQLRGG